MTELLYSNANAHFDTKLFIVISLVCFFVHGRQQALAELREKEAIEAKSTNHH